MLSHRAQQPQAQAVEKTESVDVLVATKDFQMGDKLSEGLAWKAWPKDSVTELMITRDKQADALKDMAVARVRMPIFKDEPLITKKVLQPGAGGFMSANLPKGMRAEAVAISTKTSAGGFILPNDRVDVILTKKSTNTVSGVVTVKSETVVSSVKVLAVNQVFKQVNDGDPVTVDKGETATLELTPEQAEVLATVQSTGDLSLVLRSIAENDGKSEAEIQPVLADKYQVTPNKNIFSEPMIIRAGNESRADAQ
ncbi:MAG: Flp pilus assembly protein CpaB [Pseudomonadota bacterium]|nr:Flp pilus assembly protein CpaB [Pseudomonadota bacterium]